MKASISSIAYQSFKLKLIAPEWYLKTLRKAPELIDKIANGVGSETSWTYHLTPDTILFKNINAASHPHDLRYTFPLEFASVGEGLAWKRRSDYEFYLNLTILIKYWDGWFEKYRLGVRDKYMTALDIGGSEAFWINKVLPPDYDEYYAERPVNDLEIFSMYKKTWLEICTI